jgi:hypothetical protein
VDFALAQLVQVIVLLSTGGANGGGYMASNYVVLAIYGAMLVIHGAINSLPIQCLSWFGQLGAFWNAAGNEIIFFPPLAIDLLIKSPSIPSSLYCSSFARCLCAGGLDPGCRHGKGER